MLSTLVLYIFAWQHVLGYEQLPIWVILLSGLSVLLFTLFNVARAWLVRVSEFMLVSKVTLGQNAVRVGVQTAAGIVSGSVGGFVAGDVAGRVLGLGQLQRRCVQTMSPHLVQATFQEMRITLQRYWKFAALGVPSSLIDTAGQLIAIPLIGQAFGTSLSGKFLLVQYVTMIPVSLVSRSVGDVFQVQFARLWKTSPPRPCV